MPGEKKAYIHILEQETTFRVMMEGDTLTIADMLLTAYNQVEGFRSAMDLVCQAVKPQSDE